MYSPWQMTFSIVWWNIDDYQAKTSETQEVEIKSPIESSSQSQDQKIPLKKGKETRQALAKIRQEKNHQLAPYKKIVSKTEKEIERLEASKT